MYLRCFLNCFRINNEYSPVGRCGFALVGHEQTRLYQLLIYKQKNNIISTTNITPAFAFIKQKNNYITINDDKKHTWTIHFHNETDLNEFSKVMSDKCMCKVVLEEQNKPKEQKKPTEKPAKTENTQSQNTTSVECTKTDDKKLLREKPKISPKTIPLEPNLKVEDKPEEEEKPENKATETNVASCPRRTVGEGECPQRNDSDTDSSGTQQNKADILSRVAKMGKKIIKPQAASDSSDIDEANKQDLKNSKRSNTSHGTGDTKQVDVSSLAQNTQTCNNLHSIPSFIPIIADHQLLQFRPQLNQQIMVPYPDATSPLVYPSPHLPVEQLSLFFAESRTHSSEMRMNLMRLQSGVDEVLNCIKKSDSGKYENSTQTEQIEKIDLTKENERLIKMLSDHEKTISALRSNLDTLKKKNDELSRKDTVHTCEIASLTQETARCAYEEHKLNLKVKEQQAQLSIQATKIADYEERLDRLNSTYCDCVHIKKTKLPELKDSIKEQMNVFYNEACGIFKGESSYDGTHIKKILAPLIIDNTYKILNTLNELFSSSEE